jgi:hypothetical protein
MQDPIPDLWPEYIARTEVPTPLAILRIQANNLRTKTKGIIEAEVRNLTDNDKKREIYQFEVIAPALDGYTVRLFTAEHAMGLVYPIDFQWNEFQHGYESASTPEEIYSLLKIIFQSNTTRSVLMSLIAGSNERRPSAPTQ